MTVSGDGPIQTRRRAVHRLLAGAVATLWLPEGTRLAWRSRVQETDLRVDRERLLGRFEELKRFGRTPEGGIDRLAFSDADLAAREFMSGLLRDAGCEVGVDLAGNVVGRRPGRGDASPIVIGSHIDSVPGGGNFDGQVGSMASVEVAAALEAAGRRTRRPLEVILFQNEEGGKTGSRALIGEVRPFELDIETASGFSIRDGIRRLGGDPARLEEARRAPGSVFAFFELHVEQGAELDRLGVPIGVVEGIVGIKRWTARVVGFANHAGTTPMDRRSDAMVGAARLVLAVNEVVRAEPGTQVGTVGRLSVSPGAPNVIPGEVSLSIEVRDLRMETIERIIARIRERAAEIGRETRTSIELEEFYVSRAAPTHETLRGIIEAAADSLGLTHRRMPSGAGHDAQSMAALGPVGMIFVPSLEGISHSPLERTRDEDLVNGAEVLLASVLAADELDGI